GGVATERAFLMVLVMLAAVLVDRRALSLRTVALAGVVILALAPESLMTPGFQMSFAATVALIVIYPPWQKLGNRLPWYMRPAAMLVLSSVVAGFATAPYAAAHFGRMAHYGVLANLLVVPVVGVLVMPMGPLAVLLAPFGLAWIPLWVMGLGTRWMLFVGEWIAGLNGAVTYVVQPQPWVIPVMTAGAIIAMLCWRGPERGRVNPRAMAGVAMMALAGLFWLAPPRPHILIAQDGAAVGVLTPEGRALSKPRGGAFTVGEWLEKDGDGATQPETAARPGWSGEGRARQISALGLNLLHLTGKSAIESAGPACRDGAIIVSDQRLDGVSGDCILLDARALRQSGAIAISQTRAGPLWTSTAEATGRRPWAH
ncbi:MAG: ComEC/Rec2 family competence protein, partial [Paracoccus sp. (in: a-proteobacteria)]|nr:ComEC/Rec2 family competence protein [Paracoccus sp. (in: a-proteobacteria)]